MKRNGIVDKLARVRELTATGAARQIRINARISLSEVGTECDVSPSTVHRWETGARRPKGDPALAYARLLTELQIAQTRAADIREEALMPTNPSVSLPATRRRYSGETS